MKREEAIALLKHIAESKQFSFSWISLFDGKSGFEIHLKLELDCDPSILDQILEKRRLKLKKAKNALVIYKENDKPEG